MSSDQYKVPKDSGQSTMSYGEYTVLKGSGASVTTQGPDGPKGTVDRILKIAGGITEWNDSAATRSLRSEITKAAAFGKGGDKALLQLIHHTKLDSGNWDESFWTRDNGKALLSWMLSDAELKRLFIDKPREGSDEGEDELSGRLPIHYAIENQNLGFLATFLGICYDFKFGQERKGSRFLQQPDLVLARSENDSSKENCVHLAVKKFLLFTSFMVAVCSATALTDKDGDEYTPLHRAMTKAKGGVITIPSAPSTGTKAPLWDDHFNPPHILEMIKKREDADQVLQENLTATNKMGRSPYQAGLNRWGIDREGKLGFKESFKSLIFQKVKGIQNVSTALYGNSGNVKELSLDMSDFNQSSHNFKTFVEKLTSLGAEKDKIKNAHEEEGILQFEDTLFFVHLPDINYVKPPCPHTTLQILFVWLQDTKKSKPSRSSTYQTTQ